MMAADAQENCSFAYSKSSLIVLIILTASLLLVIHVVIAADSTIHGASTPESESVSEDRQAVDLQPNLSPTVDFDLDVPVAPGIMPSRLQTVPPGPTGENVMRLNKSEQ